MESRSLEERIAALEALLTPPVVPMRLLPSGEGLGLPAKATPGAAAYDLRAAIPEEGALLFPGKRLVVPCGFAMALPPGWEGQVRARSGLAARFGIGVLNGPGTLDADYRGEIGAILVNHGEAPFPIRRGDRIAQLVIARVAEAVIEPVETLPETGRGERGFGSTGRT